MATAFDFVLTDPATNLKPGRSSAIRSRCMQGINKREGSRRSRREKKTAAAGTDETKHRVKTNIPASLSQLSHVQFAAHIDSDARDILLKAFSYQLVNPSLSPLDRCVDFGCIETVSCNVTFADAAFLHSILCTSYAIDDLIVPTCDGFPGRKVAFHLHETLALLAKKMDKHDVVEDDSILYAIINLSLLAAIYGDWEAAATHFAGLHRILQLRGGLDFLRARPKLHFKVDRLDLAWSLSSGKHPFFLLQPPSWRSVVKPCQARDALYQPPSTWNRRLTTTFLDFQSLSHFINDNTRKHSRYNASCFQKILSSIESRLIYLTNQLSDPVEELIRLVLLAFLSTTFRVPSGRISYTWIAQELETAYERAANGIKGDEVLKLWVLLVAAISVSNTDELWLREAWKEEQRNREWQDIKQRLETVMWIECIHDDLGRSAWQRLAS